MTKSQTKICNSCHTPNNTKTSNLKYGNCLSCRQKSHQRATRDTLPLKPQTILVLIFSTAALALIAISARSVYRQHIVFPYPQRGRALWYEFTKLEVAIPVMVLLLLATGLFATAIVTANYNKRFNSKPYKKTIIYSFCIGWLLHWFSIFFGHKIT
ncbi:hypothetical protein ACN1C3_20000 [Pseudomonas sp. H11T01]|uniref:hypothetical protein n=1 Tax=Pseudomonas sp. H11T01 TaxID=3402749 RepID=UPI003AC629CA